MTVSDQVKTAAKGSAIEEWRWDDYDKSFWEAIWVIKEQSEAGVPLPKWGYFGRSTYVPKEKK
jgi:hypothetical protein